MNNYTIYHNFVIKASPQEVFLAISDPDKLKDWWPKSSSGEVYQGGTYHFDFGPDYQWYAIVSKYHEYSSFEWEFTNSDIDWNGTKVGFELTEKDDETIVAFYHSGWKDTNEHFKISNFCWGQLLVGLKRMVEKGEVVPFEKRN